MTDRGYYMDGDASQKFEKAGKEITAFTTELQIFSRCLASCYTRFDNSHKKVNVIRSKLVRNTMLYRELHFQAAYAFLKGFREVLSSYVDLASTDFMSLEFEDFASLVEDVAVEAARCQDQARLVQDLHVELEKDTSALKEECLIVKRQLELDGKAHIEVAELQIEKFEKHNNRADTGKAVSTAIKVLSTVALPFTLGASSAGYLAAHAATRYKDHHRDKEETAIENAIAAKENAMNAFQAVELISGPMATCVKTFSEAISNATKFFSFLHVQLQDYKKKADEAVERVMTELDSKKVKVAIIKMKPLASQLLQSCNAFMSVAPSIGAELDRICAKEGDGNHVTYIQQWLLDRERALNLRHVVDPSTQGRGKPGTYWAIVQTWVPYVDEYGAEYGTKPAEYGSKRVEYANRVASRTKRGEYVPATAATVSSSFVSTSTAHYSKTTTTTKSSGGRGGSIQF